MIDWINSFNDPYCILINSLEELRDGKYRFKLFLNYINNIRKLINKCECIGIALCHLVGSITCS